MDEEKVIECQEGETLEPVLDYFIPIGLDNLENIQYDKNEFAKAVKEYSYISGVISALKTAGLDNESIISYLMNKDTIEMNYKLTEMNNKTDIEKTKIQQIILQQQQI